VNLPGIYSDYQTPTITISGGVTSYTGNSGGTAVSISGTVGTGSAATSTENRPKYLSCLYIIKVK